MRSKLEAAFGPAQPPSPAEVQTAVKEILQAEAAAQLRGAAPLASGAQTGAACSTAALTANGGTETAGAGAAPGAAASAAGGGPAPAPAAAVQVPLRAGRAGLRAAAAALATLD